TLTPPLHSSALFPYTTLFRSQQSLHDSPGEPGSGCGMQRQAISQIYVKKQSKCDRTTCCHRFCNRPHNGFRNAFVNGERNDVPRSEEHTSELQSRENLVCRLL